jgi:uncharacterized protein YndB with AHSA1/START domain
MNTDRIEKKIVLKAPRERVWLAITSAPGSVSNWTDRSL